MRCGRVHAVQAEARPASRTGSVRTGVIGIGIIIPVAISNRQPRPWGT